MPTAQERARWFVKNEWRQGRLPHPKTLVCSFCPNPAVEYHHYLGHAEENWGKVLPVCRKCHYANDKEKQIFRQYAGTFKKKYELIKAFIALHQKEFDAFVDKPPSAESK